MLAVLICEDNKKHRSLIESIVKKYIAEQNSNMKLVLSTDNPFDILENVKANPDRTALYFLDVDLKREISGIDAAVQIKRTDLSAKIVFITTHHELAFLTFTHKVHAMDYIVKTSMKTVEARTTECLTIAYERYLNDKGTVQKFYSIKVAGEIWNIALGEILFCETSPANPHSLVLHMKNRQVQFRGTLNDLANLDPMFFPCSKSYVVNLKNIRRVDKTNLLLEMIGGETIPITVRKIKPLTDKMKVLGIFLPINP